MLINSPLHRDLEQSQGDREGGHRADDTIMARMQSNQANFDAPVLLVDDDHMNIEVSKAVLTSVGLTFDIAMNGKQAIKQVKKRV